MSVDTIKEHMNGHHSDELKGLVKLYGGFDAKDVSLENVDGKGLKIKADGKEIFAPFPGFTEEKDYKNAIISLCQAVSKKDEKVLEEVEAFKNEFDTILLSSLSAENEVHISYSPLLRYEKDYYLYVSEVAQHCSNLRKNPNNVQFMFIENEDKSKSIIARKRLTYDASVEFMPRDSFFEKVFDSFESKVGKRAVGSDKIRQMTDFHLVKINFKKGRFVKGFGQAYTIDENGKIAHMTGGKGGMPHSMPHKK